MEADSLIIEEEQANICVIYYVFEASSTEGISQSSVNYLRHGSRLIKNSGRKSQHLHDL